MECKTRVKALDSLRGIAAAAVVIAHAFNTLIKGHTFDEYTPLYLFRAAHESVIFFFLLSGYVLTLQIQKQGYFDYKHFIIQRFFRIYIPYLVIIALTFILFAFFSDYYGNINLVWPRSTLDIIKSHLILIGNFNTNNYDNVIWSLVHEVRVALIFPLLLFIISFKWINSISIAVFLSLLAGIAIVYNRDPSLGYHNSYLYTVHYFSLFVIGALIAKNSTILSTWYLGLKNKIRLSMLILSLLVFSYSRMLFLIPHKFKFYKVSLFNEFVADWLAAIAAGFFIISAIQIVNKRHWLLHSFPLFLGKISYSLYLVHIPIIIACFNIFSNINRIIVIAISIVTAIIISIVTNKYIEKPAAILGKRFSIRSS